VTQHLIEEAAYATLDAIEVNARLAALERANTTATADHEAAERTARLVEMAKRAQGAA
jgi:hypothetical protein